MFLRKKWSKYNSNKTIIDWISFMSKLESKFYEFLRDHEDIKILELQPKFVLQEWFRYNWKSIQPIKYIADFLIEINWDKFYIDSKWMEDAQFKMKHKMWLYKYRHDNTLIVAKNIKDLISKIF